MDTQARFIVVDKSANISAYNNRRIEEYCEIGVLFSTVEKIISF